MIRKKKEVGGTFLAGTKIRVRRCCVVNMKETVRVR
jgi:hypothetical protein